MTSDEIEVQEFNTRGEISKLCKRVKDLTKKLDVPLGDIWRLKDHALEGHGIRVEGNAAWLEEHSLESYLREWKEAPPQVYSAIKNAISDSGLGEEGNNRLNAKLAEMAVELLLEINKIKEHGNIYICDIGAGKGDTIGAILGGIKVRDEKILRRIHVRPIEPSSSGIKEIRNLLKEAFPAVTSSREEGTDIGLMELRDNWYDLVVSNAALHHKSFPTHLPEVHRILNDEGAFLIGDWYTEIWYRPEWIAYLLKDALDADKIPLESEKRKRRKSVPPEKKKTILEAYMELFKIESFPQVVEVWENTSPDVKKRNEGMLRYVKNLRKRLKEVRGLPDKKIRGLYLFEAHQSHDDFLEEAGRIGFETNLQRMRKDRRSCKSLSTSSADVGPLDIKEFSCVDVLCKKIDRETGLSLPPAPPPAFEKPRKGRRRTSSSPPTAKKKTSQRIRH